MTFQVELSKCRYPLHEIDTAHLWPQPSMEVETGPIVVKQLDNGDYFVEDGRHRVIRALLRGEELIDAIWYDDWLADIQIASLKEALQGPLNKPSTLHNPSDGVDSVTASAFAYPWLTNSQVGDIYDAVVLRNGAVVVNPDSPVRDALLHALDDAIYKAVCGRENLHEPHAFGEHMEEFCSGQPRPRRALCGKTYKHKPHDASLDDLLAPDEVCDGIPK